MKFHRKTWVFKVFVLSWVSNGNFSWTANNVHLPEQSRHVHSDGAFIPNESNASDVHSLFLSRQKLYQHEMLAYGNTSDTPNEHLIIPLVQGEQEVPQETKEEV